MSFRVKKTLINLKNINIIMPKKYTSKNKYQQYLPQLNTFLKKNNDHYESENIHFWVCSSYKHCATRWIFPSVCSSYKHCATRLIFPLFLVVGDESITWTISQKSPVCEGLNTCKMNIQIYVKHITTIVPYIATIVPYITTSKHYIRL